MTDSPVSYFRRYQWDHARYPLGASLATISDGFNGVAIRYGDDLKVLTQKYGEVKTSLQALLKKERFDHLNVHISLALVNLLLPVEVYLFDR